MKNPKLLKTAFENGVNLYDIIQNKNITLEDTVKEINKKIKSVSFNVKINSKNKNLPCPPKSEVSPAVSPSPSLPSHTTTSTPNKDSSRMIQHPNQPETLVWKQQYPTPVKLSSKNIDDEDWFGGLFAGCDNKDLLSLSARNATAQIINVADKEKIYKDYK